MYYKDYINALPSYKPAQLIVAQSSDIIKLSSNENVLGPSPLALQALQNALGTLHRYPDSTAYALRQRLAERAGLPETSVICSNGSDEMILLICLAFLREGDEAVMATGSFISYLLRTQEMGGRAIRVPLRDYTHDLSAMAEAITPRTRLLFVCNPNNPTGTTVGADEVQMLLERVPEDVMVVMDEAYIEFVTRSDYPHLVPMVGNGRKNLLLLRTFAKIYGLAGLRLGYTFGHPEVIAYLDRTRPVFNVNALAQAAGIAALGDDDHVARSRAHAEASRAFFIQALGQPNVQQQYQLHLIPSETNFFALHVGDDIAVTTGLREHRFTVTPLSGWGLPGWIRVSFGTYEQNESFLTALLAVLDSL